MNKLAMIVAASENKVIGVNGDLPWRLSADLKRFKRLTMGHHIIMGRKTYDSIGRLLPGRTTVIVTRQSNFICAGALTANSIEEAIALCGEDDLPFVTGGAEIYRLAIPFVSELHLTRVHTEIDGDTKLPEIEWADWNLVEESCFQKDEKNSFDYSFQTFIRS